MDFYNSINILYIKHTSLWFSSSLSSSAVFNVSSLSSSSDCFVFEFSKCMSLHVELFNDTDFISKVFSLDGFSVFSESLCSLEFSLASSATKNSTISTSKLVIGYKHIYETLPVRFFSKLHNSLFKYSNFNFNSLTWLDVLKDLQPTCKRIGNIVIIICWMKQ